MKAFSELLRSTILSKWVMAISGLLLVGFLVGHLAGNLLVFVGKDDMNSYAVELRHLLHGSAIWIMRAGLIVAFVAHVVTAIKLARLNRGARSSRYARTESWAATLASRTMTYTGLLILFYVLYHLAHFTWGTAHPEVSQYMDEAGRHDVYRMIVESFHQPGITVIYVVAMIVTALHLNHAIWSATQTLGINHPRYTPLIRQGGAMLSILLAAGFLSVPVSILLGIVK